MSFSPKTRNTTPLFEGYSTVVSIYSLRQMSDGVSANYVLFWEFEDRFEYGSNYVWLFAEL